LCKNPGHTANRCKRCHNCGGYHLLSECTKPRVCSKCHKEGHTANVCHVPTEAEEEEARLRAKEAEAEKEQEVEKPAEKEAEKPTRKEAEAAKENPTEAEVKETETVDPPPPTEEGAPPGAVCDPAVAAMLAGLELQQYAGAFADHKVDMARLATMREEDLQELGVALGHRGKIMEAIA